MSLLEAVAAHVLRLAGNYSTNCKSRTISAQDLTIIFTVDKDLQELSKVLAELPSFRQSVVQTTSMHLNELVREFMAAEKEYATSTDLVVKVGRVLVWVCRRVRPGC
jgi:hypothetical protein